MRESTGSKKLPLVWVKWLGGLILVSISGWWGYSWWQKQSAQPINVQLTVVSLGTVEDSINQIGMVKLAQQQTLKSLVVGRVENTYVSVGDRVTAGQLLLLLQDDALDISRLEYELSVERGKIDLEKYNQAIATAEADVQDNQNALAETQLLFDKGYVSGNELEEAEQMVRAAEARLETAQLDLQRAYLDMQTLILEGQKLQQEQRNKQVLAPGPAIILDLLVQRGTVVAVETPLMVLGDPTRELVHLQLPPLRAQQVEPLQLARVSALGPNAEIHRAQVREVALVATNGEDTTSSSSPNELKVVVELDTPSGSLIPGTQVSVDIITEQRINVPRIDAGAVQQGEDGPFVWIIAPDDTAQKQTVTLGLEGLTEFEVIDGLEEGDRVIILPDQPLEQGSPVRLKSQLQGDESNPVTPA